MADNAAPPVIPAAVQPAPAAAAPPPPAQPQHVRPPPQAPIAPPNAPAAPEQQAAPVAQVAPQPPAATNPIPAMNNRLFARNFGRLDSVWTVQEHIVQVAAQATLPAEVYNQLQQISSEVLPLTLAEFTRMWRTLILKRVQDIYEMEKKQRPDNFVRLIRNIMMPAPLADLLYSLGSFYSPATGFDHHLTPPARAAQPPNWWSIDAAVLRNWDHLTLTMAKHYVMKEYPSQRETSGRPLVLTIRQPIGQFLQIKAFTNEPRLNDAFINLVNDELFASPARYVVDNAALNMTNPLRAATIRGQYVASYVTDKEL